MHYYIALFVLTNIIANIFKFDENIHLIFSNSFFFVFKYDSNFYRIVFVNDFNYNFDDIFFD